MNKFIEAPIDKIVPTKDNPRDAVHKKNGSLQQLTESIKTFGVKVPILLRPHPEKKGYYELRAGERRLYAAKKAQLKTIPAVLCDMTDIEAFETTMVENSERLDLTTIEEIKQVSTLLQKYGGDTKAVADRLNMTEHQVKLRSNALNLSKDWKKAMVREKYALLTAEHYDRIARLPKDIQDSILDANRIVDWQGYPMSIKDLDRFINNHFIRALSLAPWDQDVKIGKLRACTGCPTRSDAEQQADLWQEPNSKKTACCLDAICWTDKQATILTEKYREAKKEHTDLRINRSDGFKYQEAETFCKMAGVNHHELDNISSYKLVKAKKTDKVQIPYFILGGSSSGKVVMYTHAKGTRGAAKAKAGPKPIKSMKERKRIHHGLRLKTIYPKLIKAICNCLEPKDTSLEFAAAVAAVYGTNHAFSFDELKWNDGKLTRDELVAKLAEGKHTTMGEGWDSKEKIEVDLAGAIWLRARGCFSNIIPHNPNADDALKAEDKCKEIAVLVGFDWEQAMKEAIEEKPDPKIWSRLKADGSPK